MYDPDPHDRFEVDGLRLLATGIPRRVLDHVDASGRDDLVAELLRTDALVRDVTLDVPSVQAVVARTTGAPLRLRLWAAATLAERLAIDGEPSALVVARQALDELEGVDIGLLPPLALRYARARLWRVMAASWLMVPSSEAMAEHFALRDRAIAELMSCGFTDEVHASRGGAAGMLSTILFEDITENHDRLLDARAALGDHESLWTAALDYFVAISCFEVGDLTGSLEALGRLERSPYRHRRLDVLPLYGRAFFRLVTAGVTPAHVDGIVDALADVRRHDPRVAQTWYLHVAQTLCDMGAGRHAGRFALLESELPAMNVVSRGHRRLLQLRVAALDGEKVDTDDALRVLDEIEDHGQRRRAARTALRLAHDVATATDLDGARRIHRWGRERMPPQARCTLWERFWLRPVDGSHASRPGYGFDRGAGGANAPAGASSGKGLEVRVLAPTVEVDVEGKPVALSDAQAKLFLALIVAHPAPLHVEQASDALWPDETLDVTRARLNSLVHRLRRVLHPHGDAISRTGDRLTLDEERCRVDLWWFQRALGGSPEQRKRALLAVRGNLGEAQFPYDESFVDLRHRLSGEWVRNASRAYRDRQVTIAELEPALASLKLTAADVVDLS